ncbi:MAG: GntR family transcriptional regulator [Gemmatimonadota bacterium]|jgi:GntR family transcriptional regulator
MFEDIDPRSPNPLWGQIATRVKVAVAAGELLPGEAVPSVRELARRLRVNPATVSQAYRELAREGFLETRHGAGTFVKEVPRNRRSATLSTKARELVRGLLQEGARLGISARELVEAFQQEVGSKVND